MGGGQTLEVPTACPEKWHQGKSCAESSMKKVIRGCESAHCIKITQTQRIIRGIGVNALDGILRRKEVETFIHRNGPSAVEVQLLNLLIDFSPLRIILGLCSLDNEITDFRVRILRD